MRARFDHTNCKNEARAAIALRPAGKVAGCMQTGALFAIAGLLLSGLAGCAGPSPQEEYNTAVNVLNAEQARLDNLRPAYDAARQTAILAVCKELAGATPDELTTAAFEQLQGLVGGNLESQADDDQKPGDIDATIDQLLSAQSAMAEQSKALLGSAGKAGEVMEKIKTPGTAEHKRFVEVLAAMPEVQAYERQEKRLERAEQAVERAEAALPGGKDATTSSKDVN